MNKNSVGRPIEKIDRKKIGLSLDGITTNLLDDLSKKLGKTKSKIVEEALLLYNENNKKLEEELALLDKARNDPYYKLKDMLYTTMKK